MGQSRRDVISLLMHGQGLSPRHTKQNDNILSNTCCCMNNKSETLCYDYDRVSNHCEKLITSIIILICKSTHLAYGQGTRG